MSEKTVLRSSNSIQQTVYPILFAVCFGHFLNDLIQSILPAVYPLLKENYSLSFTQVGFISFAFQLTASLLQPLVGNYTDRHPKPFSFVGGMLFSLSGILLLAFATDFMTMLLAASLIGIGSSIFHPEASRLAYYASGGKRGLAQSIFQLGGNGGHALGPLLVAVVVMPFGQEYIAWFVSAAFIAIIVLTYVGKWYKNYLEKYSESLKTKEVSSVQLSPVRIKWTIAILLILIFSKFFYTASIGNYYTFYLIEKFHVTKQESQYFLFTFMLCVTFGTLVGGPLGDRFGRKIIIWFSILGAAPFTLALPYLDFYWTTLFISIAGTILASAFSSILVYAQELLPGKIGMVSGLFYGFAFGMGALGSAILGVVIDETSVTYVYQMCSFLPLIGVVAVFLPNIRKEKN